MTPANFSKCIFLTSIIFIFIVAQVVCFPAQLRASYDGTRWETSYCPPPCQAGNNFAISNNGQNNPNPGYFVPYGQASSSITNYPNSACPRNTYLDRFGRCVWGEQVIGGKCEECKQKEKLYHHSMMEDIVVELGAATRLKEVKIGYGSFLTGGSQSTALQQVTVQILNNQKCNNSYGSDAPGGIVDHMLCAAYPGKDASSGNSGGPLLVQSSPGSPWIQAGIVSWGNGCAQPQYPGVYTRVTSFMNWIGKNAV